MAIPAFFKIASEVSKAKNVAEGDVTSLATKGIKKFNPDKRIDTKNTEPMKDSTQKFNPDKRLETSDEVDIENETLFEFDNPSDIDINELMKNPGVLVDSIDVPADELADGYFTKLEDRLDHAKHSKGTWSGEPGKSEFTPDDSKARAALEKKGENSISYNENGEPDFHSVSEGTVEIDNMTENRLSYIDDNGVRHIGNYDQADIKMKEKWNAECKDGRNDWTTKDVEKWVSDNNLTRHECLDKKTVEYVDSDLHKECKHYGGCSECKERDKVIGGEFDV